MLQFRLRAGVPASMQKETLLTWSEKRFSSPAGPGF